MKISRMNKGEWGNVKAYFDIETVEHFVMKGFKIVLGSNGLLLVSHHKKIKMMNIMILYLQINN